MRNARLNKPSIELAQERLPVRLGFRLQPARSDGNVRACLNRRKKFLRFFDRRRKVGVAEQQYFALGIQHAVANAVSLAAITGVLDQAQFGMGLSAGSNQIRRCVPRTIIHH